MVEVPPYEYAGPDPGDEAEIRRGYWSRFREGEHVLDIGSHGGLYTLPALAAGCAVLSVDPMPSFNDVVRRSVELNPGFSERHKIRNGFVGSGGSYPPELLAHMLGHDAGCIQEFFSVDGLRDELHGVDVIKVDVEGGEADVVLGAARTLAENKPRWVIEDHTGLFGYCAAHGTRERIQEILRAAGYAMELVPFHSRHFIVAAHEANPWP